MTSRLRAAARAHGAAWRELLRWSLRRPPLHPGDAFPYARALTPVLSVFIGIIASVTGVWLGASYMTRTLSANLRSD